MTSDNHIALGRLGEQQAADWYEENGCQILDRNWRCREGEIDLVVFDPLPTVTGKAGAVAFVEVKARSSDRYGHGFEAVGRRKQAKLRLLATRWLATNEGRFERIRFDVVSIDAKTGIVVFKDCF